MSSENQYYHINQRINIPHHNPELTAWVGKTVLYKGKEWTVQGYTDEGKLMIERDGIRNTILKAVSPSELEASE